MNRHVNAIAGRLSLRSPQRESLEILDRVTEILPPAKGTDVAKALEIIRAEFSSVTDFERDFPSLCFALATGVGKTRLMGAFVSYLYLAHGIRHFFVLAPNLTIYNKLISDFTPGTPKYVLQGIAEFATTPPEIITGDNYESGRGVRAANLFGDEGVHINVFNISKINAEVRGGSKPRIKRLSEYIGKSYFDYLASLDDLVLIMDESHRYRASAGVRAINELQPILGLELTATPQVEVSGGTTSFNNVIYSYPLCKALDDGFVKIPAVATRENFEAAHYTLEQLERLKLEDGVRIHENTKVELEVYARQHDQPIVKPFMLVVANDTTHANDLLSTIQRDDFFDGRYRDRVITVHSNQRGEEKDETVEKLLTVEKRDNPTEIVIHVNMLKEGWDVTNLYTIVPLRAANSRTLVEQSIGRGLRLPFGKRVGVPTVDRLNIVAHDRFQEIVDEAHNPNSVIRAGVVIGRDIPLEPKQTVVVPSLIETQVTKTPGTHTEQSTITFHTPAEQAVAKVALQVIQRYEHLPTSSALRSDARLAEMTREVEALYTPEQGQLTETVMQPDIRDVVQRTVNLFIERSIDIPRIVVVPKGEVTIGYRDFDLDVKDIHLLPVDHAILIQSLHDDSRQRLTNSGGIATEPRLENYLVRSLMDFSDVSYDDQADLLFKLAGQLVDHLHSYLSSDEEVANVLQFYQRQLAAIVHTQLIAHRVEHATEYEAKVNRGFTTLRTNSFSLSAGEVARNFRTPVAEVQYIRGMVFGGFQRCLYPVQKFDSDSERRFAMILEDEARAQKWFKPAPGQFRIFYHSDQAYEPDFVVETATEKLICEPKRADQVDTEEVQAKKRAAITWCQHATTHELQNAGKPWRYVLIPHDAITASATLQGLVARYA
jgi:type III restriction enzyme